MAPDRPESASEAPKAKGIARLTVHIPSAFKRNAARSSFNETRVPPRWNTLEFRFYYLVALFAIPVMIWLPVSLSQAEHRNYPFYASRLSSGWIFGRFIDNSDAQYRSFRDNVPILLNAALGYLLIKYIAKRIRPSPHHLSLMPLNVILSLGMILALHGSSSVKILLILAVNFILAKKCGASRLGPTLTWIFNGAVLFSNELFHGYRFGSIVPGLAVLDSFSGVYPRWHIIFNITMLRLISFNMDYYWSCKHSDNPDTETRLAEKQRVSVAHREEDYSVLNYLAYILYPPLYIAGPIITFNDFMWQHKRPLQIEMRFKVMYLIRFICCFLTMEFILHFMYVVAIKDRKAWVGDSPAEIAMIGFWNLIIVWLKLLIPWRFFRLWALFDGIDPPENMVRCMANNYSAFGFWRSWHRSYNLWIIRYIYIPLGGANNVIVNTLLVFSFVALWHDLTFRLLAWGWLISLFVLPELTAAYLLPTKKYGKYWWYRHACAVGGVLNILMMMAANLVGFVVGTDGVKFFFSQLFGTWEGIRFMVLCSFCLFVGVQLMFEYREEELRQGIVRRC
ncbi:MBOAT, membrane-bound O-acyltransferase family-domain-containing protein [Gymnopilus junonius]|uniref:MBOAT, membrane-bound O-acyltransferase family-domain-containing protein n=1 Tax=Gymnopilus junonius TaxID=109634 RepID=A0A9P5TQK3_GYMJU|nr:MBOAT, membrane-bound O-acyltransferase family-domain-containing protein [Gymnopilus junonius]